ncbi:hypothetical protein D3C87_2160290 [compost metagenome]
MVFALAERFSFFQHAPDPEQKRDNHTADHKGNTPAPFGHFPFIQQMVEQQTQQRGKNHGYLLAP